MQLGRQQAKQQGYFLCNAGIFSYYLVKYIGICIYDHIINSTYFSELLLLYVVPLSGRQGCVFTFSYIPLIELFVYFDLPTCPVSCSSECRSAAEPGSFYLVPGSLHQIFCYISIKNTPNLFDSFYSVFFIVTFSYSR